MNPEIESLMSQYLDGRVTAKEAAALAKILSENAEAAERFAELTRMDEGLRVALKAESRSALFASRLKAKAEMAAVSAKRPADRRRWLAVAAGLTVLGGTAWWFSRDGSVPTVVMDWAKARVKRQSGGDNSSEALAEAIRVDHPLDKAAELRRKLRGFAIPDLHLRSMAVSEAVNTLNRQWTDLPHKNPADAKEVKIDIAASARKLWRTQAEEPVVTLDIPRLSLHTALNLVAAQAGLRLAVGADSVSLEPEPPSDGAKKEIEDKTWTFPLAKATADTFLASIAPKVQPVTIASLERQDFFLTQKSSAPELTSWKVTSGQVSMFPVERLKQAAETAVTPGLEVTMSSGVQPPDEALASAGSGTVGVELGEPVMMDYQSPTVVPDGEQVVTMTSRLVADNDSLLVQNGSGGQVARLNVRSGLPDSQAGSAGQVTQSDSAGQATVTMLKAEQHNLDELGYSWLKSPDNYAGVSGAQGGMVVGQPENVRIFGREVIGNSTVIWGEANMPGTLTYQIADPSGSKAQPWYFDAGATASRGENVPTVPDNLPAWLATFGLSAEAVSHDVENGVLSVTGSPAALRVASAAVAALTESAQSGVSVEMRVLDLGDLPRPDPSGGKGVGGLDSGEVEALCRKAASHPGSACVRLPVVPGVREQAVDFKIAESKGSTTSFSRVSDHLIRKVTAGDASSGPAMALEASVQAEKQGERWTVNLNLKDGNSKSELNSKCALMEGAWWVCEGATPGPLYLFRLRSAAVTE